MTLPDVPLSLSSRRGIDRFALSLFGIDGSASARRGLASGDLELPDPVAAWPSSPGDARTLRRPPSNPHREPRGLADYPLLRGGSFERARVEKKLDIFRAKGMVAARLIGKSLSSGDFVTHVLIAVCLMALGLQGRPPSDNRLRRAFLPVLPCDVFLLRQRTRDERKRVGTLPRQRRTTLRYLFT